MRAILTDLAIACRSALRQRRRSAFALSAISAGVAALLLATGFIEWNFLHYRETMIKTQLGHIRVHRAGYTEFGASDPFHYLLSQSAPEFAAIAALPEVATVAPRVSLTGLASHGDATLPFVAEGMDPVAEAQLAESVIMVAGDPLVGSDPAGVIVGQGLATNLGIGPKDGIVLVVTTPTGGINAIDAHVRGIFSTVSKAYDDIALRMPIESAHRLLKVKGSDTWVILLHETDDTEHALERLRDILPAARYESVPWWRLSDFYNKSAELFSRQTTVMKVIIGLLIVLSISNTLMMGVIERTGEIGTSMALGTRRASILRRFVAEAIVLGAVGAAAGSLLGAALGEVISAIGIPVPPPPGMGHGYMGRIRITGDLLAGAAVLALTTTTLAALYPAWKASRLVIVDALRRNR